LRAVAERFGHGASDALDATLTIEDGDEISIQHLSNHEEPLQAFSLKGRLDGKTGPVDFAFKKQGTSLTLKMASLDDETARRFGQLLIEQLLLSDATAVGLSLSGGGFRATLFHLGVIRFLKDAELLPHVTHVFSVSGGSIMAAHLALHWHRYLGNDEEFSKAATDLIGFTRTDVRGWIIRRWLLGMLLFWLPPARRRFSRIALLQRVYTRLFRKPAKPGVPAELQDLAQNPRSKDAPNPPEVHILATAMKRGDLCAFDSDGFSYHSSSSIGNGRSSNVDDDEHAEGTAAAAAREVFPANTVTVAAAVAASSAFPPFFPPLPTDGLGLVGNEMRAQADDRLSDGGVFDNLGTRRFMWMREQVNHELKYFFVSDASAPFDWARGKLNSVFARTVRATGILMRRVGELEFESASRRDAMCDTKLIRCDITKPLTSYWRLPSTAGDQFVRRLVARIRTDLNTFSPTEIRGLIWHGYLVAREAYGRTLPLEARGELKRQTATLWDPLPQEPAQTVEQIRESLKDSDQLTLGWRNWVSDWASWALAASVAGILIAPVAVAGSLVRRDVSRRVAPIDQQLSAANRAVSAALQLRQSEPETGATAPYALQFTYAQLDEIKGRPELLQARAANPDGTDAVVRRLEVAAGKQTESVRVEVSQHTSPNGHVSWHGIVESLTLPTGKAYKLAFGGTGVDSREIDLQFVQTPVSGQSGANAFSTVFRQRFDGVYVGELKHPDLGNVVFGRVTFTPLPH
jgi:predicted acylesterase/phospholipase RssA